jgi:hypothetical protein
MNTGKQEATDITTTFFHVERTIVVHLKPAQRFFLQLIHQWYARLVNAFQTEIGVYYSGEKSILPITVTTYQSAGDLISEYGNTFQAEAHTQRCDDRGGNDGRTYLWSYFEAWEKR